ncbi:hypothetical protein ACFO4E_25505 [Nocardiopsis mangrovi]|uniref:Chaplin domain-containing protein n=1 Tax=Nocardiopsis mangrovi TaxID=1179818 RepID=A0ABV9E238_9ACTN
MKKLTAAGLIAAAAMGAVLMASPAQASGHHGGDQQFNQNLQLVPIQVCNANIGVAAITIPILSPQTTGDCVNGPIHTNVD